ncbi:Hypothetical protein R9X50_00608100 [Acrodontium crateriforme]|uniref:Nuclear distribution protein RO10 n=1 Tax=Acrodontium crateriforme TaxID=150365 RepID=A0AAQ3M890_9PEZI|nr:Hypothetical protein R9X50_00608100 [Acrodontium crateriforme]
MSAGNNVTVETLTLLEERLQRIDYALNGYNSPLERHQPTPQPPGPATARLRHLEKALQTLTLEHEAVANTIALHNTNPSLFHPGGPAEIAKTLPADSLASVVISHASLYTSTCTNLSAIQATPISDPSSAAELTKLQPRIEQISAKQEQQARQVAELRSRSAKAVEQWYSGGVLGMGERWANWEERSRDAEILIRRKEAAKKREAEGLI